jgi:hypothetical protein
MKRKLVLRFPVFKATGGGGMEVFKVVTSRLNGVMVSGVVIGLNVRGLKPARGDKQLRAIKIRSTPSFGREVRCRKILRHVNEVFLGIE